MVRACWLVAWLVAGSHAQAAAEDEKAQAEAEGSCDSASGSEEHYSANRGADLNRSGWTPHAPPSNLSRPAWTFGHLDGSPFHQTPVIDRDYNVYMGSDAGYIFSLDKHGNLRWKIKVGSGSAQCPSLHGNRVYTASLDGFVFALQKDTGQEIWRSKVAEANPTDTYAVTATDEIVLAPAWSVPGVPFGAADVVALEPGNGTLRWRYTLGILHKALAVNLLPVVHNGSVVFSDSTGGVHHLRAADGAAVWVQPGDDPLSFGLGGVALGPNGVLYIGSTTQGSGLIRAMSMDGKILWQRRVPLEIHAAPAIASLRPGGPLALVIGTGRPTYLVPTFWQKMMTRLGLRPAPYYEGIVHAMDAATGDQIWTFRPEPWREEAAIGADQTLICMPDLWSLPVIASDGTTYINWSAGGVTYALKDANGDGLVNESDSSEVQSYSSGSGATGPPVVAPGMMVVGACRFVYTFLD